jgi:hypothetical protein
MRTRREAAPFAGLPRSSGLQCCDVEIDHVETEFRIEVPKAEQRTFQRESAVMIAVDRVS